MKPPTYQMVTLALEADRQNRTTTEAIAVEPLTPLHFAGRRQNGSEMRDSSPDRQPAMSTEDGHGSPRVVIRSLTFQIVSCCHCPNCCVQPHTPDPVAVEQPRTADGWWSVEQAAAYLNLTPKSVREGAARRTLPGHKYPAESKRGRWLFKKDELDRCLKKPVPRRRLAAETAWN